MSVKEGHEKHRHTQREDVTMEAEIHWGGAPSSQGISGIDSKHWKLGMGKEEFCLRAFGGRVALLTP